MGTPVIQLPGGISGVPFSKGSNAAATAQNQLTLAARAAERYVLRSLVISSAGVAAVSLDVTISNIIDEAGALQTVTVRYVENANGAPVYIDFGPDGLWSAPNTQVQITVPANGASAASSILVNGVKVSQ